MPCGVSWPNSNRFAKSRQNDFSRQHFKENPARSARSGRAGVTFFNEYKAQFIDLFEQVQSWIN